MPVEGPTDLERPKTPLQRGKLASILLWLAAWPLGCFLLLVMAVSLTSLTQSPRPDAYGFSSELWETGFFAATGTLEVEGESLPPNHAEITCRRDFGECVEARAEFREGQLSALTDRRQITRWDDAVIIASSETACGDVIMTIDRALETVNMVRIRKAGGADDPLCSWMNPRNSYRLIDGAARFYETERSRTRYIFPALIAGIFLWTVFVVWRGVATVRRKA